MTEKTWIAREDVASSKIGDDLALLDPTSRQYFTLNQTGATVWAQLAAPKTLQALTDCVASTFDVTAQDCAEDVKELIEDLNQSGLIKQV